jgi:hypothetical protein
MQIVTISSHNPTQNYYMYPAFLASCRRFGFEPLILTNGYKGLGTKPKMLKKAIVSGKVTHTNMIFTDAWDVVFQRDPSVADEKMDAIIFNAEKNCFPDARLADKFPETRTTYRYLNSGFSIGPTELYLQALKEMKADDIPPDHLMSGIKVEPNDQLYWQKQYLFGNTRIRLDTNCEYCQTLAGVTDDELLFDDGVVRNRITGMTPLALHANGSKEVWKDRLLAHLNLGKEFVA